MVHSEIPTLVDVEAFPGDWLDEVDRESVRRRHAESVERWLDQASFASELFKLHTKYDIDHGDEGYVAYRLYLQQQYEKSLLTGGPMVDPLGEGCDCLFCRFDHEAITFRPAKAASADEKKPEPPATKPETMPVVKSTPPPVARSPTPDESSVWQSSYSAALRCSPVRPTLFTEQPGVREKKLMGCFPEFDRGGYCPSRSRFPAARNDRFAIASRGPPAEFVVRSLPRPACREG